MVTTQELPYFDDFLNSAFKNDVIQTGDHCRFDLAFLNPVSNPVSNLGIKEESDYATSPESDQFNEVNITYGDHQIMENSPPSHTVDQESDNYMQIQQAYDLQQMAKEAQPTSIMGYNQEGISQYSQEKAMNGNPQQTNIDSNYQVIINSEVQSEMRFEVANETCEDITIPRIQEVFPNYQDSEQTSNSQSVGGNNSSTIQESDKQFLPQIQACTEKQPASSPFTYDAINNINSVSSEDGSSCSFVSQYNEEQRPESHLSDISSLTNQDIIPEGFCFQELKDECKPFPPFSPFNNSNNFWNQTMHYPVYHNNNGNSVSQNFNGESLNHYYNYRHSQYSRFLTGTHYARENLEPMYYPNFLPYQPIPQMLGTPEVLFGNPNHNTPFQQQFHPNPFLPYPYNMYKPPVDSQSPFLHTTPLQEILDYSNKPNSCFPPIKMDSCTSQPTESEENSKGKVRGRKKRICYSAGILHRLEEVYRAKRFITISQKESLSKELGLTELQVKVWFQNRRMKDRRITSH